MFRSIYLGLAIVGALQPLRWYSDNGFDVIGMVTAASSGLMWNLLIGAAAVLVWILAETYVRKDYGVALVCIAATLVLGVSCGLPLFLYLRTRPIR